MTQATLQRMSNSDSRCLYMALELSASKWKLALAADTAKQASIKEVEAGDMPALYQSVEKARRRFGLLADCRVVSCYEAGRDGFWVHRALAEHGIENLVVDSASIEVNRKMRRAKSDRLDAISLVKLLMRHDGGEPGVWGVVRVPSERDEDARRLHRELKRLQKERAAHSHRIGGLLATQGVKLKVRADFLLRLEEVRRGGWSVGPFLERELRREHERWCLADEQIRAIGKQQHEALCAGKNEPEPKTSYEQAAPLVLVAALCRLRGLGERSAWQLVFEFFWRRDFANRREVGAAAGLVGTPYLSGTSQREQGISKAGNKLIRSLMVELAWYWLRFQPDSGLSRWFNERFAAGGSRMRRVGIIGLARRLLIAIWRYLRDGVVPEGAVLKAAT